MKRNVFYYLKKFGQFTVSQLPFNEVDALILSELCYMDFHGVLPTHNENSKPIDINTFDKDDLLSQMAKITLSGKENIKMMKLIFESERYKDMKIDYYVSRFDKNLEIQFSAMVFMFSDCNFIAFRGTDATLIGWKEDFNMSYLDVIPSQKQCLEYINKVVKNLDGKIYLGGHSKGGNLACFAGIYCDKEIQEKITCIYDFDGPGFKYDIFNTDKFLRIKDRVKKYVTRDSMIGVIMHHIDNYEVVKCNGVLIMQHDPFRWRVTKDGKLDTTESTTFNCKVFERTVRDVMMCYSDKERSKIVEILFNLLDASEKNSIIEFKSEWLHCLRAIRRRYKQLDKPTVIYLKKVFKEYWNIYFYNRKLLKKEIRLNHDKNTKIPHKPKLKRKKILY